jgi:hypothetical protein
MGGLFYDERKSPTGERWAAGFDARAKRVYDAVSPYLGRNVTGVAMLPALAAAPAGGSRDRAPRIGSCDGLGRCA